MDQATMTALMGWHKPHSRGTNALIKLKMHVGLCAFFIVTRSNAHLSGVFFLDLTAADNNGSHVVMKTAPSSQRRHENLDFN